jgi:hypothetical protein
MARGRRQQAGTARFFVVGAMIVPQVEIAIGPSETLFRARIWPK